METISELIEQGRIIYIKKIMIYSMDRTKIKYLVLDVLSGGECIGNTLEDTAKAMKDILNSKNLL